MKLSVIIPCFNAADTIAIQLEALANQHWSEPWEVIISDNGSTDESLKIVEQYKEQVPNLRIIDASDLPGGAHARNMGALSATGDGLAFCDADDEVGPRWVAAMGEALSKYDFVTGPLDILKLNESWVQEARSNPQPDGIQNSFGYLPHAIGCNMGVKRLLHEKIGGHDKALYLQDSTFGYYDTSYSWRVQLLTGAELHFEPDAVVYYRYRSELRDIYRQARLYGRSHVLLYKAFQPLGMPKPSWKTQVRRILDWGEPLINLPQLVRKGGRTKLACNLGYRVGRLQGSIKHKIFLL
jgi:glycosyltransferase involved in cell wall biosynthesis